MSIEKLQSELENPWRACRLDASDRCGADVRHGVAEIRMVHGIEKLHPELQAGALPDAEAAEQGRVQVHAARPVIRVAAQIAELADRRQRKRRGIEILLQYLSGRTIGAERSVAGHIRTLGAAAD